MKIDIIIPYHPKDEYTIKPCIDSLSLIKNVKNVYVISKHKFEYKDVKWVSEDLFPFKKDDICKINTSIKSDRAGWYLQQLLKMYALQVIEGISDNILLIDSDVIFLKEVNLINNDNKISYNFSLEYHKPYFDNMQKLNSFFERSVNISGICHFMLFQKYILDEIFELIKVEGEEVYNTIIKSIDGSTQSGFSEYELYFHYIFKKYPNEFLIKKLKFEDVCDYKEYLNCDSIYIANHAYKRIK